MDMRSAFSNGDAMEEGWQEQPPSFEGPKRKIASANFLKF